MQEGFSNSTDGLQIHYMENLGFDPSLTPLVIVPGMMGIAEFHTKDIEAILPRRTIAITHRGLGKNQPLNSGEGNFTKRVTDIEATVSHLNLRRYFLYAFSRGVSLAVAHTLQFQNEVAGLILHDCEPIYPKMSEKSRDHLIQLNRPHMPANTIYAYWEGSEAIDLSPKLADLKCPVLVLRGEKEGSLLSEEKAMNMLDLNQSRKLVSLPNSAHELDSKDRKYFIQTLNEFIREE